MAKKKKYIIPKPKYKKNTLLVWENKIVKVLDYFYDNDEGMQYIVYDSLNNIIYEWINETEVYKL